MSERPGAAAPGLWIGAGESGREDCFGPLVVATCLVDPRAERALDALDLSERRPRTLRQGRGLARRIRAICPVEVITVGPERYNQLHAKLGGAGALLAWALGKAVRGLLERYPACDRVLTAALPEEVPLAESLEKVGGALTLESSPPDESHLAVRAAEVMARALFLDQLRRLSEELGEPLPCGLDPARDTARRLGQEGGRSRLGALAKLHLVDGGERSGEARTSGPPGA